MRLHSVTAVEHAYASELSLRHRMGRFTSPDKMGLRCPVRQSAAGVSLGPHWPTVPAYQNRGTRALKWLENPSGRCHRKIARRSYILTEITPLGGPKSPSDPGACSGCPLAQFWATQHPATPSQNFGIVRKSRLAKSQLQNGNWAHLVANYTETNNPKFVGDIRLFTPP